MYWSNSTTCGRAPSPNPANTDFLKSSKKGKADGNISSGLHSVTGGCVMHIRKKVSPNLSMNRGREADGSVTDELGNENSLLTVKAPQLLSVLGNGTLDEGNFIKPPDFRKGSRRK